MPTEPPASDAERATEIKARLKAYATSLAGSPARFEFQARAFEDVVWLLADRAALAKRVEELEGQLDAANQHVAIVNGHREKQHARIEALTRDAATLRKLLWLRHHATTAALYGDDGEMQCSECLIDFKRDAPDQIEAKFWMLARAALSAPAAFRSLTPDEERAYQAAVAPLYSAPAEEPISKIERGDSTSAAIGGMAHVDTTIARES